MNYDNFCVSICFWFPQPTVIGKYLGLVLENINLSFVNSGLVNRGWYHEICQKYMRRLENIYSLLMEPIHSD